MARLPSSFNASEHEKLGEYTPIPAGVYLASIVQSEMKDTQAGDGKYLQLTFAVMEGEYAKRNLWVRLNLQNQNQQTVEIAQKTLATIADCCGFADRAIEDSEELHNIPMYLNVIVKPAQAQYAAQNDVKGFTKYDADAAPPAQPAPVANGGKTPPWKKAN